MAAALLQAERLRERLVRGFAASERTGNGRRYRIEDGVPVLDVGAASGRGDVVAVPTEEVLLLAVELPLPSPRRRLEALPFAIEDRIAEPLEAVHVALGAEIGPNLYLAAVVRHATMRAWVAEAEAAGADAAAIVPDALLLPSPAVGQWSVAMLGERAVVRTWDGTGLAVARAQLPAAWRAAGQPGVIAWTAGVPAEMQPGYGDPALDLPGLLPIDLRQGLYAWRRPALSGLRRRALTIAAGGVLAHGAIAAADTLVLRHQAHVREAQTRTLIAAALPAVATGDHAVSAAAAYLPSAARAGAPDPLLPLLSRVAAATGPIAVRKMDYERAGQRLVLGVEPGNEARLAAALASAGLSATAGPGTVIVRGAGA